MPPQLLLVVAAHQVADQEVDVGAGQRVVGRHLRRQRPRLGAAQRRLHALHVDQPGVGDEDVAPARQAIAALVALVEAERPREVLGSDDHVEAARVEVALHCVPPAGCRHLDQLAERTWLPRPAQLRPQQVQERFGAVRIALAALLEVRLFGFERAPLLLHGFQGIAKTEERHPQRVVRLGKAPRPRRQVPVRQRALAGEYLSQAGYDLRGLGRAGQGIGGEKIRACSTQVASLLREQPIERGVLSAEDLPGPGLGRARVLDVPPRALEVGLQRLDLLEAGRGQQQTREAITLASEELELPVHARQLGPALSLIRLHVPDPRVDGADALGAELYVRLHCQVPMALGRSTLLGDALTLRAHAVEPGQPMLGLPRLGLELLVVLEVGLERGGVHGPRVQQVIEDEVAHLAHRLEVADERAFGQQHFHAAHRALEKQVLVCNAAARRDL